MRSGKWAWIWLGWLLLSPALAGVVELEVRPGVRAGAAYLAGEPGGRAVLLVHGFLQTREFSTVQRLAETLHEETGASVLSPTLSLGIDLRRRSLPCEALHLHRLDQDVAELAQWVEWLADRHRGRIVLIGHSAGGHVITRYLATHPDAPVERVILISLSYPVGRTPVDPPRDQDAIGDYSLGFCLRYPTTPRAYRSYVDWGAERMLAAMQQTRMPVHVIIGSGDRRIRPGWIDTMRKGGVRVHIIEGANHFFDSAHEFDLDEMVESLLNAEATEAGS